MKRILEDIRVLDFGRFIACPYCGMMLADMGAEVVRVERTGGEEDRSYGLTLKNGENMNFQTVGRNKKAITLNLVKNNHAKDVLRNLVQKTDVVIHSYTPQAARAMGLNYEALSEINPRIILAAFSCYGSEGPYSDRPGFDFMAQAMSGAMCLGGFPDKEPVRSFNNPMDYGTGMSGALGVVAAIRHRDQTGEGQQVDLALLRTAVSMTAWGIGESEILGQTRPMIGNRSAYVSPSDLYRCQDGHVFLGCIMNTLWRRLVRIIDREDLLDDPELSTDIQRFNHRHRIDPLVRDWIAERTVGEVVEAMEAAHIPCAKLNKLDEVSADPHVRATGMLPCVDLEEAGLESVPVSVTPILFTKTPTRINRRPPRVGEHTHEVLNGWLGYDDDTINQLKANGAI